MEDLRKESVRTLGDGMDSTLVSHESAVKKCHLNMSLKETSRIMQSLKPVQPQSKIYNLVPRYVPKVRKHPKYITKKMKEPKFIPYEPYKAAVEPIIRNRPSSKHVNKSVSSKNNVEIQELVDQMSQMRAAEMAKEKVKSLDKEEELISMKQWKKEKMAYEADIKNLRETNSHLENQLKMQCQVNSELKTLLVAAVGEDLETRVQHLTEDKLQLARALLNSANHLTSHQEQTEWLSGQCEVWRSKFLASSLMVEELARWKSALTSRINDLQENVKNLMEDRKLVQKSCLSSHENLKKIISGYLDETPNSTCRLKSSNIVDLSSVNLSLTNVIVSRLNCERVNATGDYASLDSNTLAEKMASKLLQNPVMITNKQEAICNALVGAAVSCGEQMYLQYSTSHNSCCPHCSGEVKNI